MSELRVLIVEDSEEDARLLFLELRRGGYEVTFDRVDTPLGMAAALARSKWDIVIADYSMPEFSAPAALLLLQESGLDLPFIILSGSIGENTAVEVMRAGASDYIMKDNLARLLPAVDRELREATVRRERREAEEALRQSEERFRQLAETISQVFWMTNPDKSEVLYISPAYERIWGRSCRRLYERPDEWMEAVHPEDRARLEKSAGSHQLQKGYDEEFRIIRPDGTIRWIRDRAFPVPDKSGRIYRITGIAEDITPEKEVAETLKRKSAEAEESSRLKSQFVSNVSHELRTPINAIIGYSYLLFEGIEGAIDQNQKVYMEGIIRNANDLLNLVNDVLDLSKIESGKLSVHLEQVNLSLVVRAIALEMSALLEKKSIQLHWVRSNDLPRIKSDGGKIKQIFTNLLSNAVKFTRAGSITILEKNLPEKEGVEIAIQDTGIGILPEEMPKLFSAFYQVDAELTREYGGVGLGLRIVKDLVDLLHGEIRVKSKYDEGSTFTVFLPYSLKENL